MVQSQIIIGSSRRRTFSEEQKLAIVAEAFLSGNPVRDFAWRHDIPVSSLYKWRRQYSAQVSNGAGSAPVDPQATDLISPVTGKAGFAEVLAISEPTKPAANASVVTSLAGDNNAIEIVIGNNHLRIPSSIPAGLAAAVISALVAS